MKRKWSTVIDYQFQTLYTHWSHRERQKNLTCNIEFHFEIIKWNHINFKVWQFFSIDNNRHRCYTALKFSPPANQGKHRVKRILYSSVRKRLCLALPCWKLAGKISYRPFCTASGFCCMLSIFHKEINIYLQSLDYIFTVLGQLFEQVTVI